MEKEIEDFYPYREETEKILECVFAVANTMGSGFLESAYQKCLEIELSDAQIPFESQKELAVYYRGQNLGLKFKADIIVNNTIILELKAKDRLKTEDEAQIIHYLKATGYPLGLLINFGHKRRVEYKRFINSDSNLL